MVHGSGPTPRSEFDVSSVLAKLGVRNRTELPSYLAAHRPPTPAPTENAGQL
jgi:hypothetical protein